MRIRFFKDPFQLSFGNEQESPLIRKYLEEKYQLVVDVAQLSDKTNYSPINAEALKCVSGISNKMFNHLQINQTSDAVIHLTDEYCGVRTSAGEGGMFAVADNFKVRPSADAINFGIC